jgi:hypothetical protein
MIEELKNLFKEDYGITIKGCQSSNIEGYGYNPKKSQLWVIFKGKGQNIGGLKIYRYRNVSKDQFNELEAAESKGKWVNANLVKPKKDFDSYEIVKSK